jgi:RNA ligase
MNFKSIYGINDIQAHVIYKPEIRWIRQNNGVTVGCYMFMDSHTFDAPEALECRGIAFNDDGKILSRPLHKFFNLGEKADADLKRPIYAVYEKLDGSIISTSLTLDGGWCFRSRKSYDSDVVHLANEFVASQTQGDDGWGVASFCDLLTREGFTASFELTSPKAQIVIPHAETKLRLLHVRDNVTGEYVMIDDMHPVWGWIRTFDIELCPVIPHTSGIMDIVDLLENDTTREGVVVQFTDGDMIKIKTPWYKRLHRSISFMRERDIARLAVTGELDDVKANLRELGIDTAEVDAIETQVKLDLLAMSAGVVLATLDSATGISRKDFAIANKDHPYFGLMMAMFTGKEADYQGFYLKHKLDEKFTLRTLISSAADIV